MDRLVKSFGYAWSGIRQCSSEEANFRIHIFLGTTAVVAGCWLGISAFEWIVVFICAGLVICMEMVNTALENLCNMVQKEIHPAIKTIKDISAGAVLVSAVIASLCGMVIFIPKIFFVIKSNLL